MSVEIKVPALGESIVEATVGQWLKHEGERVSAGEPVVELETEKVNMEVVAPADGVLRAITKREGDTVAIGEVLAELAEGEEPSPAEGEAESAGETAAPAPGSPVPVPAPQPAPAPAGQAARLDETSDTRVSPLARRIASERGVDLSRVHGSGVGGRITQDDVTDYLAQQHNGGGTAPATAPVATTAPAPASQAPALSAPATSARPEGARSASTAMPAPTPAPALDMAGPIASGGQREERVRLSRRRLTIARRLVEAQHTAAMLTTFNEVDMSAVMELRKRRRDAFKQRHGVGLGFMSFFTRAVIGALKAYPRLNAEIQGEEMVLKHYYDIGIAVGVPEGLVVPVLRDADRMTFAEIEQQIAQLAEKARTNTLALDELQGGTFTITNGGTFGSLLSTPILNAPQVGILGMHKIEERPIALGGQVVIHPMMYLALSYDHRIVDGQEAVSFLVRVKELIEDPETLLLEG
jgi:2-oxoglutarate dehydrogenase E2 component (dihydrolipoamide succinyltransferase)